MREPGTPYGLGIDLGSGSVGWATVQLDKKGNPSAVLRMGVRRFDAGVSGDLASGREESNALTRRSKRGPRRQHWRRQWRLKKVFEELVALGLLPPCSNSESDGRHTTIQALDKTLSNDFPAASHSESHLLTYRLRALALDEPLPPFALGRALYALAQRRGFLSNRKAMSEEDSEDGVVRRGIAELDAEMVKSNARTLGEYFSGINPEEQSLRRQWTARRMFIDEFEKIIDAQAIHHSCLTDSVRSKLHSLIFSQRPLKSQRGLVGRCDLEKHPVKSSSGETKYRGRRRSNIACLPYQEFRLLQKVNDLTVTAPDGEFLSISDPAYKEERQKLIQELTEKGDLTFAAIRKLFGFKKSKEYQRNYVFNFEEGGDAKLIGNRTVAKLIGILGPKWFSLDTENQVRLVDTILQVESETALQHRLDVDYGFSSEETRKLSMVVLEQGFGSLSRRAVRKLLPLMRKGDSFATARKKIYPDVDKAGQVHSILPPALEAIDDLNNPAVIRVLTELRKVVNELIRECGSAPQWVRVELARELKHSRMNRKRIQEKNKTNEKQKEAARKKILADMGSEKYVTENNVLKLRLAEECGFVCPYSGKQIGMNSLLGDEPLFEIEHIIPFSRSLDNSFVNKLLCKSDYNRRKSNRTPWEAFGDTNEYDLMLSRVRKLNSDARDMKLQRFQTQNLDQDEFVSRQLNDTRYASILASEYLGMLYGGQIDTDGHRRVFPTSGRITAYLRQRWNLNSLIGHPDKKNRADHRHHAIDALVTALTNVSAVKQLASAAASAEAKGGKLFAEVNPPFDDLLTQAQVLVEGISVSSRVKRKLNGELHEETVLSPAKTTRNSNGEEVSSHHVRKTLGSLSKNEVEQIVDPVIAAAVEKCLEASGKPPKDTFKEPKDLPHIHGKGGRTVPVRRVRIRKSGTPIRVGNGSKSRYVSPGSNHHMVIVSVHNEEGQELCWEGHIVTRFEAMQRLKNGEPVVKTDYGARKKFKFWLTGGDYLLLTREPDVEQLCRIVVLSGTSLEFVSHENANPSTVRKKIKGERIYASASTLRKLNARKVDVTPCGTVLKPKVDHQR